jgi:predicted ester cyclase
MPAKADDYQDDYKRRAREFYEEVLNNRRLDRLEEFLDPSFLERTPQVAEGFEGIRSSIAALHDQFPNARIDLEDIIAEGDQVVTSWRMTGGEFGSMFNLGRGEDGQGEVTQISGVIIMRIQEGKVREMRSYADLSPFVGQLGRSPTT